MEHNRQNQRVHDSDAYIANRYVGSIYISRLVSVLCVLGVNADPNVLDNWGMGRPEKDICHNKVLSIYNGGKRINAGWHHCNLLYESQGNG